jgi:hypothetical protein
VVDELLNSLLVFRLLTRSSADEAQGKLAVALAKTTSATTSTKRRAEIKSEVLATVGGTISHKSLQQPADYRAWLFTDDWYTPTQHYSSSEAGTMRSTSAKGQSIKSSTSSRQSPRHLTSSLSESTPLASVSVSGTRVQGTAIESGGAHRLTPKSRSGKSRGSASGGGGGSESDSMFQEEVYDLMSQDKDQSSTTSEEETMSGARGGTGSRTKSGTKGGSSTDLGMVSSILTDEDGQEEEDDDDLISVKLVSNPKIAKTSTSESLLQQQLQKQQQQSQLKQLPLSAHDQNRDNPPLSQQENEEVDEDDEDEVNELRIIAEDTHLVTASDTRHRLTTVPEHSETEGGGSDDLEEVPENSYRHIDTRDKIAPILLTLPSSSLPHSQSSNQSIKESKSSPVGSRNRKKRHTTHRNKTFQTPSQQQSPVTQSQLLVHDPKTISSSTSFQPKEIRHNIQILDTISAMLPSSSSLPSSPVERRTEVMTGGKGQSSPTEGLTTTTTTTTTTTKLKSQLSLKEIKEKRKQTLPARLKAAGLESRLTTSLTIQRTSSGTGTGTGSSTKTILPIISSHLSSSLSSSQHIIVEKDNREGKKSKVTRIINNENNVKLTRRASSSSLRD